jgi:REP element-mobilizing transposase RayT
MAQSYTNLIYHIVFSTKNRLPVITDEQKSLLYHYIGGTIRGLGGVSLGIGGMDDHIHILAKLRPDKSVSDVMRELKAGSSGWMHRVFPDADDFSWQNGYGAFSVSYSQIKAVQKYITDQEKHHQKFNFRNEFIMMLRANKIDFEEKYLWK